MEKLERYFIDPEDVKILLRDVDDNWNVDVDLAIEKAAIDHHCTRRQILQMLPLDKVVDYLIYKQIIPNIRGYDFWESCFSSKWLDSEGL